MIILSSSVFHHVHITENFLNKDIFVNETGSSRCEFVFGWHHIFVCFPNGVFLRGSFIICMISLSVILNGTKLNLFLKNGLLSVALSVFQYI